MTTVDDLSALADATEQLTALVTRLDAHHDGSAPLGDDEATDLLRRSGEATTAWTEAFRASVTLARGA
ncbi:MAG: hypothetical protein ABI083_00655 [Lapillicoccus sp.]